MSVIIFIIILLVLVLVHEAGHFFTARWFGMRVDEFGFGYPPKLFGVKKGETEYSFNILPFGGFVKIFGESLDSEVDENSRSRSFVGQARWKQAIVLFAGVLANFLLAWLLFSFSLMSGLPTSAGTQPKGFELQDQNLVVLSVLKDSPAHSAGLASGDKILQLEAGEEVLAEPKIGNFRNFLIDNEGEDVTVLYERSGTNSQVTLSPVESEADGLPSIGISMDEIGKLKLPFFASFAQGMKLAVSVTIATAVGLYTIIAKAVSGVGGVGEAITGPVGIVGIVGDAYQFGFVYLLSFTALISVNLAIINLIPFPALDGGRLLFLLIEKVKGSRISSRVANTLNMVGFVILILLMLYVTYKDILRLV